jgi:ketosteroid isomerase-like protein
MGRHRLAEAWSDWLGALGGHLHVDSPRGAGTTLRAIVPLDPHDPRADDRDDEETLMSATRENLEVVVAWLDAMRRRDPAALEALLEPTVVWRGLPPDALCQDRDDVLDMLGAGELHEGLRSIDAIELVAGGAAVVLGVRSTELDEIGDVPLDGQIFNVFSLRDGRIASIQDYAKRAEALRAAGVESPDWS